MRYSTFDCNRQIALLCPENILLSECASERIFTIMEVDIFQPWDLVRHFQVLQIQRLPTYRPTLCQSLCEYNANATATESLEALRGRMCVCARAQITDHWRRPIHSNLLTLATPPFQKFCKGSWPNSPWVKSVPSTALEQLAFNAQKIRGSRDHGHAPFSKF